MTTFFLARFIGAPPQRPQHPPQGRCRGKAPPGYSSAVFFCGLGCSGTFTVSVYIFFAGAGHPGSM